MNINFTRYYFDSLLWVILIGLLLSRIGTSMMIPFYAIFLTYGLGLSFAMAGFITGISYISYVFGGIFGGYLSDNYGRKSIFTISLLSYAITFWCMGLVSTFIKSPMIVEILFCAINLVAGLNRICIDTLGQAILADMASPNQKKDLFNLRYTMVNIGSAIGPIIGVALGLSGTVNGFYITGALCFTYFILFIVFARGRVISTSTERVEKIKLSKVLGVLYQDKAMSYFILGGILVTMVYCQMDSTMGQIVMQRFGTVELFATLKVINAVTVVVMQLPITDYFLKRYSLMTAMRIGCLFIAIGLVGTALSGVQPYYYIISQVIFTLGEILIFPASGLFVDSISPTHLRGSYFGAMGFLQIGRAVGPLFGGILLQTVGDMNTLFIFAILAISTTVIYKQGDMTSAGNIKAS